MSFELDILHAPPTATLTGELTIMTLGELQDDLFSLLNFAIVVLDVSQLEALDGCGAQLLALLQQEANQQNKSLRIRAGEESVAEQAGTLLREMLPGIDQTATLVQEIASASREQRASVSQINIAVTQISDGMQASAASAEELSSTSEELSSTALQLQELMQQFTLRGGNIRQPQPFHGSHYVAQSIRPKKSVLSQYSHLHHDEDLEREVDDGKFTNY